jgi:hypothetical protein
MKTCSDLKIFESLNYFVELFKVQSIPNPFNHDLGCHTSRECGIKIHIVMYLKPRNVQEVLHRHLGLVVTESLLQMTVG